MRRTSINLWKTLLHLYVFFYLYVATEYLFGPFVYMSRRVFRLYITRKSNIIGCHDKHTCVPFATGFYFSRTIARFKTDSAILQASTQKSSWNMRILLPIRLPILTFFTLFKLTLCFVVVFTFVEYLFFIAFQIQFLFTRFPRCVHVCMYVCICVCVYARQ